MGKPTRRLHFSLMIAAILVVSSCGELGYTDRVLWRVASPDGKRVAVCQEVPAFDGPDYEVRLEDTGGRVLRRLYKSYEAERCDEIRWSGDGRRLGVVTRHSGKVWVVDVEWAIAHPDVRDEHTFVRIQKVHQRANCETGMEPSLRHIGGGQHRCLSLLPGKKKEEYRRTGKFRCAEPAHVEVIPSPSTSK